MATKKISELTALTTPESDDLIAIVDASATETKKITYGNISKHIINVGTEVEEDSRVNFIHSRNLWKQLPNTQILNGITLTNNGNGTFNLSGTATANTSLYVELDLGSTNLKNGTYTLSKKSAGYNIQLDFYNGTTYVSTPIYCYGSTLENSATLSIGSNVNKVRYIIYVANGSSVSLTNEEIMLNSGNEALPYEPYTQNQIVVDDETFTDTVKVSNEVDGKSKVNVIHSRNLFDKNNVNVLNAYFVDGTNNIAADTSGNNKTIYIPCKPNTTYTIQKTASPSNRAIGYTTTTPAVGVAVQGAINISTNTTTGSITTGNNAQYLVIRVWSGTQDTITYDQMIASVQIEEGTTATPYKPFTTNEINIDNEKYTDTLKVGTNADGRSRVNVLKSKNLCTGNNNNNAIIAKLESGTYTFSLKSSINGGFTLKKNDSSGDNIAPLKPIATGISSTTFTISETTNVFLNGYSTTSGTGFADGTSEWMLNKGSTALPYEPYIVPSINVDGEMLVSKNVYSSNEVVIGEWFGKPLYRKVIEITNPTLDAWTNVNHNISNMDFGRIVDATLTRTIYGTTSYIPIGVSNISAGTLFTCDLQKTIIEYKIAGYTNITKLTAVLEYTKTID